MNKKDIFAKSFNQSGGVTAGQYNQYNFAGSASESEKKSRKIVIWLGAAGSIVAILSYLGFSIVETKGEPMSNDTYYVTSNNQIDGVTAGQYNQYNFGKQPRHLNETQKTELLQKLNIDHEITITSTWGDQEAIRYAWQIKDFLDSKGFNTKGINQSLFNKPIEPAAIHQGEGKMDIVIGANI